jgi:hypothetical protein
MMDSYLTRIYRRSTDDPDEIVGIIEEIDTGKKHSFKNVSELSAIITKPARKKRNRKTGNKQGR